MALVHSRCPRLRLARSRAAQRRRVIADANHRLLDVPDLGHVGPQFARARDQRLGGLDVVARQRGARLPQPLSNLQQIHRGLRPLPHVARPRLFFVQRRRVVRLLDRRLVVAVREGALGRGARTLRAAARACARRAALPPRRARCAASAVASAAAACARIVAPSGARPVRARRCRRAPCAAAPAPGRGAARTRSG